MKRWAVGGLIMVLALAGCSDDDEGGPTTAASTTVVSTTVGPPTSAAPSTTRPPTVISVDVQPGTGTGFEGAKDDVVADTCEAGSSGWTASGTVTNPTAGAVDYRIYVAFLDATNDTRGLVQVDVADVAAGASEEWSGKLALAGSGLTCVLRVERTPSA